MAHTYTSFGGDITLAELARAEPAAHGAIVRSMRGAQTISDDEAIGGASLGYGFCSKTDPDDPTKNYATMTYCGCVNAPVANPECIFKHCASAEHAYKNTEMQKVVEDAAKQCPKTVECSQMFIMGGASNIASGVRQTMNCGGTFENIITNIRAHPLMAFVVIVLVLSAAMLITSRRPPQEDSPPQLVLPPLLE